MFGAGVVVAAAMVLGGAERWWRLAVFLPFAAAGVNWRQAAERT
jgi:hypothetical protein